MALSEKSSNRLKKSLNYHSVAVWIRQRHNLCRISTYDRAIVYHSNQIKQLYRMILFNEVRRLRWWDAFHGERRITQESCDRIPVMIRYNPPISLIPLIPLIPYNPCGYPRILVMTHDTRCGKLYRITETVILVW